ncbi:MAG TPA: hypothetical protein VE981_16590 [Planctomycetota bacterium]|nr:hypothetical protein [Planctomycetota bacterium]
MRRAAPYLLYGAVTLVCFWKFLFFGWTLYDVRTLEGHLGVPAPEKTGWFEWHRPPSDRGDTVLSLPMLHRLYGEGLQHGELRLWNPYLFCGYPIYNNLLLHPFYPPNLILHALLPPRIAYDLNLLIHFFFSGAAMYGLLRGTGRSGAAATIGGLLWMLIGYNTFWFSTGTFMGASVFAPLALWGLRLGLERRDFRPLALGGLAMGLVILGSHGQHALHILIFLSIWMLVTLIADREARVFTAKGGALFLASALGVGMAAILTQLDSVTNGFRVPGDDLELHYRDPWMLPTYVANLALGKICYAPDGLLRSEFTLYAGVAGAGLAVVGAVLGRRDRWTRYLSIFAIVALLVAFFKPLAQAALHIPFLNLSMPARWVYVFGFCLTMLAAGGVEALLREPVLGFRIAGVWGGLCLFFVLFYSTQGALVETLLGIALAAAALIALPRSPRAAFALGLAALAFDLIPNFVCFNAHADPRVLDQKWPAIEAIREREKEPWRATGSLRNPDATEAPMNPWTMAIGSNILALYGVEAVMGYESIAPLSTVIYCSRIGGARSILGSGRVLLLETPEDHLTRLANLRYLLVPFERWGSVGRKVGEWGPLQAFTLRQALPRAYLAGSVRIGDADEAAKLFRGPNMFESRAVVLETAKPPVSGAGGGTVSWTRRETDRIELAVHATAESMLVIGDTDYPGWEAEVDGVATPIYRANITFRAVVVPPGAHSVVMRFRPASARDGLILSGLSTLAILGFTFRRKAV